MESGTSVVIFRRKIAGMNGSSLERFVLRARRVAGLPGMVNVLITNNSELKSLNRQFLDKDKPTDVLSFSAAPAAHTKSKRIAGEVAISADIARQNATRLGHSAADEVKILVLHGILHLAGYDHERDNGEMARKEMRLRRQLHLKTALIERAQSAEVASIRQKRRERPQATRRRTT